MAHLASVDRCARRIMCRPQIERERRLQVVIVGWQIHYAKVYEDAEIGEILARAGQFLCQVQRLAELEATQ